MDVGSAIGLVLLLAAGHASWGFVEYLIHGILSHRFRTPVSPLHWGHHREPHAVFTAPIAWVPVASILYVALALAVGWGPAGAFLLGLLIGFGRYEYAHWRIHFRVPRTPKEQLLHDHHLAHHFRDPKSYCGVTTRMWDRVFGTLPDTWREDHACVADRPPLEGPSNLRAIWSPRFAVERIRAANRHGGG